MNRVRDVVSLPLSRSEIEVLYSCGFRCAADIGIMQPIDLANETKFDLDQALKIIRIANEGSDKKDAISSSISARELTLRHKSERPIITFSKHIDRVLGGGLQIGQLTEIVGVPGIGKSQIAMQLAVDVHIPECLGGVEGESVYIDTEGSFTPIRAAEMAKYLNEHLIRTAKANTAKADPMVVMRAAMSATRDKILGGIHVFRVHDQTELIALIHQLPSFIDMNGRVKLVVIDSIAFHFRQDLQDSTTRNRLLSTIAQMLHQYAYKYKLGILVTNHVTTKVDQDAFGMRGQNRIVPALGEHWSHCVTNRLLLQWGEAGDTRLATLVKSPSRQVETVHYAILASGVRGDVSLTLAVIFNVYTYFHMLSS
jgi:RAD51-like protein 2